jgi:2-polyprenyl-6-methoxyphenol hydroxylase-like FAD-dependent oxidoreductase
MKAPRLTVAVIGGGPVGLLVALCALDQGMEPIVIERLTEARTGSRAIGIHPPALEILERLGLADEFLRRGVPVRKGLAFGADGLVGSVSFAELPGHFPFVLSIPQCQTEAILEAALAERAPAAVQRGWKLTCLAQRPCAVDLHLRTAAGEQRVVGAAVVVACDGNRSRVRQACGIPVAGRSYDGAYAMVDVADTTPFGAAAAVFLSPAGVVESFPLPGRLRRWVVRRDGEGSDAPSTAEIARTVLARTGCKLPESSATPPSGFHAERCIAERFAHGRVALAGNAAHVVSPIGGQGMNLGWIGAESLVRDLAAAVRAGDDVPEALARNGRARRRQAITAARRAEINMWLGRQTDHAARRERLVGSLLRPPARSLFARMFTMRHLAWGI